MRVAVGGQEGEATAVEVVFPKGAGGKRIGHILLIIMIVVVLDVYELLLFLFLIFFIFLFIHNFGLTFSENRGISKEIARG